MKLVEQIPASGAPMENDTVDNGRINVILKLIFSFGITGVYRNTVLQQPATARYSMG